ncbi:MAG: tRNA-dihydrouridine synthase, partial [Pseudomonadota bacterium]
MASSTHSNPVPSRLYALQEKPVFAVAPMMDWTDRHCRYFHRLLTKSALLYTEMVVADAIIHGDVERHLAFDASEHPLAVQLGGSAPAKLAQ